MDATADVGVLRRNLDLEIAENLRADRARMDLLLQRMATVETRLSAITSHGDEMRSGAASIQERQTQIIEKLTEFSVRFGTHVETEAADRALLAAVAEKVTVHSERLTMLERLFWTLAGACGMGAASAIGWVMNRAPGL